MSGLEHHGGPPSPGRALAQARTQQGLSVEQVATAINLRATVLRAIERDDFSLCGGEVYARGHLRAYARQVGVDEAPLLASYAELGHAAEPVEPASDEPGDLPAARRPVAPLRRLRGIRDVPLEPSGPNWSVIVGAAVAVLAVFLVVQLVSDLRGPGRGTSDVATSTRPSGTTAPVVPGSPGSAPTTTSPGAPTGSATSVPSTTPSTPSTAPTRPDGVVIALRATADSWVSVRDASGRTMFSGLLSKGDARHFTDGKALRLTVGNAGAVQLTVNGQVIGSAGDKGQVVRLKFGPNDPV